ncbi:MAG: acylneuraminate cytidylyltransferase family protein, partial [Anaerolineae bacterium]|nr:acylneuraminate cytidylyltransferase family protein [Anaerolineae bacterium]
MITPPTITALVPMRHQSERVPGKNYRLFNGQPLYHYILTTLSQCDPITTILVDTDSPLLQADIAAAFPHVQVIDRPAHLRAGTIPMNDVLLHDTAQVASDFYLQTHATNPLLKVDTIKRAIAQFLEAYPIYDSLFGVTRWQTRLWDQLTLPVNHNPAILLRTQDLPPVMEENSNLYLFTRDILLRKHNRIGERPLMFEIDRLEAWDIDEEIDFAVAEFLYRYRQTNT